MTMNRQDLREAIAEGVDLAFERLGIDIDNRAAMRADFAHLRRWRLWLETLSTWTAKTLIGAAILGIVSAMAAVLKSDLHLK